MPIDRRPIEQMVADVGEAAFRRLARLFAAETRDAVAEMRRVCAVPDWRELGRQAHSLKNSTASFGLADLSSLAVALESAADGARRAEAEATLARLEAEVELGLAALESALGPVR